MLVMQIEPWYAHGTGPTPKFAKIWRLLVFFIKDISPLFHFEIKTGTDLAWSTLLSPPPGILPYSLPCCIKVHAMNVYYHIIHIYCLRMCLFVCSSFSTSHARTIGPMDLIHCMPFLQSNLINKYLGRDITNPTILLVAAGDSYNSYRCYYWYWKPFLKKNVTILSSASAYSLHV